jgi:hypothetical protein
MARSREARGTRLGRALCVVLSLAACHAPAAEPTLPAKAAKVDLSPARQLDWLPAQASAILHFDLAKLRATRLYGELAALLPEHPPIRQVVERTSSVRVAVVSEGPEPRIVAVFAGDYDAHVNPTVLAGDSLAPRDIHGVRVLEHMRSHDLWFATPEGFWLCSEQALFSEVFTPPETRPARLSAQSWARAPEAGPLFHGAISMSHDWREQVAADLTDPISSAMFLPAVQELSVLTFDVESDGSGGTMLELAADFASSRGAQSAAFVVQAAILTAKAQAQEREAAPQPPPASGRDEAFELGRALGRSFGDLLDHLVLDVQGTRLSASLLLDEAVLEELRAQVRDAAAQAAQRQP